MKGNDQNQHRGRTRSVIFPAVWFAGAITLSILSGFALRRTVSPIDNSAVYYVLAVGHYTVSLAMAFLVFACIYFKLDTISATRYRRALSWGHFGLMTLGAALIIVPSIFLQTTTSRLQIVDATRAFLFLNNITTIGYGLTLVSLLLFVALLGDLSIRRLRRRPLSTQLTPSDGLLIGVKIVTACGMVDRDIDGTRR